MTPASENHKRLVPFEGTFNFRDLGGYETEDGRKLKYGLIFRSGDLSKLTDNDLSLLKRVGIKLVCDFRNNDDIREEPDRLPLDDSVKYLHLPVTHGTFEPSVLTEMLQNGDTDFLNDQYMIDGYKRNIDVFAGIWGKVITCLADPKHRPMVFHCAVGKDRAGTCAALILQVLNVPDKLIISDYELSNQFLVDWIKSIKGRLDSTGIDLNVLAPFMYAKRIYIESLLDHIRSNYDSAENYLITKAGVKKEVIDILRKDLLT